jgi:hypothetical protein
VIHIAFIAGIFWVGAADGLEWLLSAIRRPNERGAPARSWSPRAARCCLPTVPLRSHARNGSTLPRTRRPLGASTTMAAGAGVPRQSARAAGRRAVARAVLLSAAGGALSDTGATIRRRISFLLAGVSPAYQIDGDLRILETRRCRM